ncbi:hypothetical protein ACTFIU_009914 [Dictyostelium citrinum]
MPKDIKIVFSNGDGESEITGKAIYLPTPRLFPPPSFFLISQYESKGKAWEKNEFVIDHGKITLDGKEFGLVESRINWFSNEENKSEMHFNVWPKSQPKDYIPPFN